MQNIYMWQLGAEFQEKDSVSGYNANMLKLSIGQCPTYLNWGKTLKILNGETAKIPHNYA